MAPKEQRTFKKGLDLEKNAIQRRQLVQGIRKEERALALGKRRRGHPSDTATTAAIEYTVPFIRSTTEALQAATSSEAVNASLIQLRQILSSDAFPVDAVLEAGAAPLLIRVLSADGSMLAENQLEAVWCLTNIASGSYENTKAVLPAAPHLIAILSGSNVTLQEQAAWTLGNIAAEDEEFRSILVQMGALVPLIKCFPLRHVGELSTAQLSLLRTVAWSLSNMLKGRGASLKVEIVEQCLHAGIVGVLVAHFPSPHLSLATEIAWVMCAVAAQSQRAPGLLLQAGILFPLLARFFAEAATLASSSSSSSSSSSFSSSVSMSASSNVSVEAASHSAGMHPSIAFLIPLIRTLGHMCCNGPATLEVVQSVMAHADHVLAALADCMRHTHRGIKKEAAWVLSNIVAVSPVYTMQVIQAPNHMLALLQSLFLHANFDIQREVAYALFNMAVHPGCLNYVMGISSPASPSSSSVSASTAAAVSPASMVAALLGLVRVVDADVVHLALRFTDLILHQLPDGPRMVEEADGIDALESLQTHENGSLYQYACALIDEFWGEIPWDETDGKGGGGGGGGGYQQQNNNNSNGGWPTVDTANQLVFGAATPATQYTFGAPASSTLASPTSPANPYGVNPERLQRFQNQQQQ